MQEIDSAPAPKYSTMAPVPPFTVKIPANFKMTSLEDTQPLREPFTKKLQASIISISSSDAFQDVVNEALKSEDLSEDIYNKLSLIVNARLEELTPAMVKEIVQDMIKEHLGWLVIWGAVFGGLIGLVSTLVM